MTIAVVHVPLPVDIYRRLEQVAVRQKKSVETVLSETLQVALPTPDEIPLAIQQEIDKLDLFTNTSLRQIALSDMRNEDASALDQLLDWQNMRPLTEKEEVKLTALQTEYGRILLRKARAFALLAERGSPLPL